MSLSRLVVSSPGRVCLFGEHQDYLGLPVIASAISLRIRIEGQSVRSGVARIALPDIGQELSIALDAPLTYQGSRDYLRSAVNVLRRTGCTWSQGVECTVRGEIPINAGTSSSSALVVAWTRFLARMSDQRLQLSAEQVAHLAWQAEVEEFREPGGKMDHYRSALGGVQHLDFSEGVSATTLSPELGAFVLGNSNELKDTTRILATVKNRVLALAAHLRERVEGFRLSTWSRTDLGQLRPFVDEAAMTLLDGTLKNRDITIEARHLLETAHPESAAVGALMDEHQAVLRDVLQISTPKIDRMIAAAKRAGAVGAKINGSGGGGCMFAYAPENPERVAAAVWEVGGTAWVVHVDRGVTIDEERVT